VKRTLSASLLAALVPLFALAIPAQNQSSLSRCAIGVDAANVGFWTWPANAHVRVYVLATDFQSEEIPQLLAPLKNWNAVSAETGSGVIFEYQGETTKQHLCENCLTIMRGAVFDKSRRHATELRAYSANSDQVITYGAIVIDPGLTNLKALTNAVAHELGHNLGLLDCYSCNSKFTAMSKFKGLNIPNEVEGPKFCDVVQVKHAYEELRVRVRAAPRLSSTLPIDEGEEPVDDDTPIVVPKL
jgi:hypothetical protein